MTACTSRWARPAVKDIGGFKLKGFFQIKRSKPVFEVIIGFFWSWGKINVDSKWYRQSLWTHEIPCKLGCFFGVTGSHTKVRPFSESPRIGYQLFEGNRRRSLVCRSDIVFLWGFAVSNGYSELLAHRLVQSVTYILWISTWVWSRRIN